MRALRIRVNMVNISLPCCILILSCVTLQIKDGSAETVPDPQCSSSDGSLLLCTWSSDVFKSPDVEVEISNVAWMFYQTAHDMPYSGSCYVDHADNSTGTAHCTIRVWPSEDDNNCRKTLKISFWETSADISTSISFMEHYVVMSPPSNILAAPHNDKPRELKVTWKPTTDENPNCKWTYFCVQLEYASRVDKIWQRKSIECNRRSTVITDLEPGTIHDIRMRAKVQNESPFGRWSENITVQTLEEAPTQPVSGIENESKRIAGSPFTRTVHLSWNGIDNTRLPSLRYNIQLTSLGLNWTTNTTSLNISDLDCFSEYQGRIFAENNAGAGQHVSFKIPDMTTEPQSPIVNYTVSSTSINLTISSPDQPNGVIIRYEIRWREDQDDTTRYKDIPSSHLFLVKESLSPLKPNTLYIVEVKAVNKKGSSRYEDRVVTPQKAPSVVPRNFTVNTIKDEPTVVEIEWSHLQQCDDRASGYSVIYCALNDSLMSDTRPIKNCQDSVEPVHVIDKADGTFRDSSLYHVGDLRPFTRYTFRLRPFNQAGPGPESEPILVQTPQAAPSPPLGLKISTEMSTSSFIDVTWSQPLNSNGVIVHYIVDYNANTTRTNATSVRLQVYGDTNYVIAVRACTRPDSKFACSVAVNETFKTPVAAPSAPRLYDLLMSGDTKIRVRWEQPRHPNGPIKEYVITLWLASLTHDVYENASTSVVDARNREVEVEVDCGDVGGQREFRIEVFARTINDTGIELDGESDTKGIVLCGIHNQHLTLKLVFIGLGILTLSVTLAVLIHRRWFRTSSKLDIYAKNITKMNKRFKNIRIPKPVPPETEVFDVIRTRSESTYQDDEQNKVLDASQLNQASIYNKLHPTTKPSPCLGYLPMDAISHPVLSHELTAIRPDECCISDENGDDSEGKESEYASSRGSSGYKSLSEVFGSLSLSRKPSPGGDSKHDDMVYSILSAATRPATEIVT